jgi:hypothetical protein
MAPLAVTLLRADGLHTRQIARRLKRPRRWVSRVIRDDEIYLFGRPAYIARQR